MDDEMLTEKTKTTIEKFHNLNGNTFNEKKRSLNSFIKTLQVEFTHKEVEDFINNLIVTTEYDQALKTEIMVRFQLESSIIQSLKSQNEAVIGKLLKNWPFFKKLINTISIDDLIDNILPELSYKTNVKIIKVIGKNLVKNEKVADDLFNKLEEKFGIKFALLILSNCSINLIKEKCSKYGLILSTRCLMGIFKRQPEFLTYYFDFIRDTKRKTVNFHNYSQIFKYIGKTNVGLFWELYEKYHFYFKVGGKRTFRLLSNKELMLRYGFTNKTIFNTKHILNAAKKINLYKELLLKYYPDNITDYINRHLTSCNLQIIHMPKKQRFPLIQELFTKMYKENFENYVYFLNGDYLKYVTIEEREYILDRMANNEPWLFYYPINRSIPMLKEKLKSANDPDTREKLILALYKTCFVNNENSQALLDVLNLLYKRYKNDTKALQEFMNNLMSWKDYTKFNEEHWEVIYNIKEYLEYSGIHLYDHFFEKHFVWLVDNNKSYKTLLDDYIKKCNDGKWMNTNYSFDGSLKHIKIFIEEVHKRLENKHYELYFRFLDLVVQFDKRFPNEINILDYAYILDMGINYKKNQQTGEEFYFIKNYNQDKRFNKYIKYFNHKYSIDTKILIYTLKNCPEELDNFDNLHEKIRSVHKIIRYFLKCPYFVSKQLKIFNKLAIEELQNPDEDINETLIHFFSYNKQFMDIIPTFFPPEDAKIEPQTDRIYVTKQQVLIKHIPKINSPENMKLIRKFTKGDYLKYSLASLYKIAYKSPLNHLPEFLQDIYEAAISVKKHSLYLGRHLLPINSYYDFLLSSSKLEKNLSLRNIILKKTLEYFIENTHEKFFNLFLENLQNIDKNDRDIYDYLTDYSKIPQEFLAKYISTIYNIIITNPDEEIRKKSTHLMENLPNYIIDQLEVDLMEQYLSNCDLSTTNFINKCLFHTTGEKHLEIYGYIFSLITDLFKKCTPTNVNKRSALTYLILKISNEAVILKNEKIIEKLYTIYKSTTKPHTFISTKILLEFSTIFLKSQDLKIFAQNIKPHLKEFIDLYSLNLVSWYTGKLKLFLDHKLINKFLFIQHFFNEGEVNELIYLVAIGFLPTTVPSERNAYAKYLPILEKLQQVDNLIVMSQLDLYFLSVCGDEF